MQSARDITTYRKFWAARFGTAPYLPTSRAEMDEVQASGEVVTETLLGEAERVKLPWVTVMVNGWVLWTPLELV